MRFPDNRGRASSAKAAENKRRIIDFFKRNPEGLQRECADELGLHLTTVEGHIRDMKLNGIPEGV